MMLIQNVYSAEGPIQTDRGFESHLSRPILNKCLLGNQCCGPNLAATALEEPRRFVCKRAAGGYSVAFLILVAINRNRICNASVVRMSVLPIVFFFFWHFPNFFFLSRNTCIGNNILLYRTGLKLDKKINKSVRLSSS